MLGLMGSWDAGLFWTEWGYSGVSSMIIEKNDAIASTQTASQLLVVEGNRAYIC